MIYISISFIEEFMLTDWRGGKEEGESVQNRINQ